jgi:uncharacterized protein
MRVYVDSSALVKRVVAEQESPALIDYLDLRDADGDLLASSSLAWVEVSRAIRSILRDAVASGAATGHALTGVDERPIGADAVALARRLDPPMLRSLYAVHLASAILIDADVVVTYDDRLAAACERNALQVTAPGR